MLLASLIDAVEIYSGKQLATLCVGIENRAYICKCVVGFLFLISAVFHYAMQAWVLFANARLIRLSEVDALEE